MLLHYSNPALEAELAYRRELLEELGRPARRKRWTRRRRERSR